ncbi:fibronectin type III domain-containing protein [Nocardioides sp.]|uniref:fibronectin type III domain-containing protein n=1 Tax=Nocardioides sp. TaxID=35761 RepID=UPI0039E4E053
MKLNKLPAMRRAIALGAGAATVAAGLTVFGLTQANAAGDEPIDVILGVGATQTDKVISWYFPSGAAQQLQISKGATFEETTAKKIAATTTANTIADTSDVDSRKNDDGSTASPTKQEGYYNSHVELHNLEVGATYTYRVGATDGTAWSDTYTFSTGTASPDFKFAFFGDPQIGSSGYSHNDGQGWAQTLKYLADHDGDTELLVSGGDQVESANNEWDWRNWADPDADPASELAEAATISPVLKEYTWAPTIGNHEGSWTVNGSGAAAGRAYHQHFFPPNLDSDSAFFNGDPTLRPGGDYWFKYKEVLFIDLNSNAYDNGSDAAHVAYVSDVIKNYGAGTKWQVLVYHHAIYSPADHANDADNKQRAADFTTEFSNLGVDLVLQGHDHAYSRSYELKNGQKANSAEQPGATTVEPGPGGVIYVTANSASGSKFYDLTVPDTAERSDYPADTQFPDAKNDANQARHYANSVESQQYVPSYIKVEVKGTDLVVTDLSTGTCADLTNSAVRYNKSGQRTKADGTTYGDTELCALGDQRPAYASEKDHLQTPGAVIDNFTLIGPKAPVVTPPAVDKAAQIKAQIKKIKAKIKKAKKKHHTAKVKKLRKKVKKLKKQLEKL